MIDDARQVMPESEDPQKNDYKPAIEWYWDGYFICDDADGQWVDDDNGVCSLWFRRDEVYRDDDRFRAEIDSAVHTAWQWLSYYHRVPKNGVQAHMIKYDFGARWYYYYGTDTVKVDKARYEELKKLYIDRYGGWDRIDLDHTTYDGRKWW